MASPAPTCPALQASTQARPSLPVRWPVTDGDAARLWRALEEGRDPLADTELADALGLGVWVHDLVHDKACWNTGMWALRGRPGQIEGPDLATRRSFVHPDDHQEASRASQRLRDTDPIEYEFRVCWPDGTVRWLASRSVVRCDESGHPILRIGLNWDCTDTRQQRLADEARRAAQAELVAKSRFLARLSHELRTPLHAMLGAAQLLEQGGLDDTSRSWLARLMEAGRHLQDLVDDVMELSRLRGEEMPLSCSTVDLQELVVQVVDLVQPLHAQNPVRVHQDLQAHRAWADALRLRQVLLNLLSNAIKYNVRDGEVWIRSRAGNGGGHVIIEVEDSGPGLTEEQVEHLFEPFNRLGAEHGQVAGSGIGLTISRNLVQRMGGWLSVTSRPGQGSTFSMVLPTAASEPARVDAAPDGTRFSEAANRPPHIDLPLPAEPAATPRPEAGISKAPEDPLRILYIEDNPVNTMIVQELVLRITGTVLRCAAEGREGIDMARDWLPDVLLVDMQLPDMNGLQVLTALGEVAGLDHARRVVLSANVMQSDIQTALRAGFHEYWTKPLDHAAFRAGIERLRDARH